ncbi:MAG: CpsD/CapB family tyrosine-protein kinase [Candidatus Eiseniibacteriota bacterium]|nr:MAG: CpsD/CapB family tyrosine-protein kinase [Candidatus Eisenbacteria bacterium]
MSKISDALDKADRERRKGLEGGRPPEPPSQLGPSLSGHLPSGMWRELGIMRNLVESQLPSRKFRSLLITAATPGEGVSTVTANFAKTLADDPSLNIFVVDANSEDAAQHEMFQLDNSSGFVEFARGDSKLDDVVRVTPRTNLCVVTSGAPTGGMFQLAGTERVAAFIETLRPRFHYLFFDAPPVLTYPETAVLGSRVDGVLLVVRSVSTRREAVARARDALVKSGCNIVGVVLNRYKYSIPEFIYKRI